MPQYYLIFITSIADIDKINQGHLLMLQTAEERATKNKFNVARQVYSTSPRRLSSKEEASEFMGRSYIMLTNDVSLVRWHATQQVPKYT